MYHIICQFCDSQPPLKIRRLCLGLKSSVFERLPPTTSVFMSSAIASSSSFFLPALSLTTPFKPSASQLCSSGRGYASKVNQNHEVACLLFCWEMLRQVHDFEKKPNSMGRLTKCLSLCIDSFIFLCCLLNTTVYPYKALYYTGSRSISATALVYEHIPLTDYSITNSDIIYHYRTPYCHNVLYREYHALYIDDSTVYNEYVLYTAHSMNNVKLVLCI